DASYYTSQRIPRDCMPEKLWHSAGFGQFRGGEGGKISICGRDEYGRYYNRTYAGYDGPDEDGFGMTEEYNYYVYDEFFNLVYTFKSYSRSEFDDIAPDHKDYTAALQKIQKQ